MKKILLSLIAGFLNFLPCSAEHAWVKITWLGGASSEYVAKEYWTNFNMHIGYWAFNQLYEDVNTPKAGWVCIADFAHNNYMQDYEDDYKAFYNFMKEEGHLIPEEDIHFETHHEKQRLHPDWDYWWYCVSFRQDAFMSMEIQET